MDVTLKDIMAFFGMSPKEMSREWKEMTDLDKADIKEGLGNGTLWYPDHTDTPVIGTL
jgi:hypothetical protein